MRDSEEIEDFYIAQLYEDIDKVIAERNECRKERKQERFAWITGTLLGVFVLTAVHMPVHAILAFAVLIGLVIDITGKHCEVHTGVVSSVLNWAAKR